MNTDLSSHHEPISDLFSGRDPEPLSEQQIESYHRDGFLTGIRILNDRQIDVLRSELELLMQPEQADNSLFYEFHLNESKDPGRRLFHALGAWRISHAFHDLIFCPAVTTAAMRLLDGPVRFWHDQIFAKPAKDGGVVAWHQDYSYWTRTAPVAHLTCWIGLDDSNEENGCLNYVPGSHRWDLLPRNDLANDMDAILDLLDDEQKQQFRPVPSILEAGEASFHHPMTVHGSYENRSDRPRRAVVLNFIRDGVESRSDEPLLEGVPPIPTGQKLEGQFFPLVAGGGDEARKKDSGPAS